MTVRAKMQVAYHTQYGSASDEVRLTAVTTGGQDPEDQVYGTSTPSGHAKITLVDLPIAKELTHQRPVYLHFAAYDDPAPDASDLLIPLPMFMRVDFRKEMDGGQSGATPTEVRLLQLDAYTASKRFPGVQAAVTSPAAKSLFGDYYGGGNEVQLVICDDPAAAFFQLRQLYAVYVLKVPPKA